MYITVTTIFLYISGKKIKMGTLHCSNAFGAFPTCSPPPPIRLPKTTFHNNKDFHIAQTICECCKLVILISFLVL